jgi:hypothetical protein
LCLYRSQQCVERGLRVVQRCCEIRLGVHAGCGKRVRNVVRGGPTWGIALLRQAGHRPRSAGADGSGNRRALPAHVDERLDRYNLEEEGIANRTVYVDTSGISAIDFNITEDTQNMLFENGQAAAARFLENLPRDRRLAG